MLVKDLNEILKRCGFNSALNEKPVNSGYPSKIFLQMAHDVMLTKPVPEKFEKWTKSTAHLAEAIRYIAIAIYLLEEGE